MHFSLRRNNIHKEYNLGGSQLTTVAESPYLGLTLSSNLSWQTHITNATRKANQILGLLRRNLRGCPQKLRQQAYFSLVRPHVEYSSVIWNPYSKKDINRVEMIQRRAARFVLKRYHHRDSVTSMLQQLEWESLEKRRQAASLIMMFKIHTNAVAINPALYATPMLATNTRQYHPSRYQIIPARVLLYQNAFFPRTITWWNALPASLLTSSSVEAFRGAVTSYI